MTQDCLKESEHFIHYLPSRTGWRGLQEDLDIFCRITWVTSAGNLSLGFASNRVILSILQWMFSHSWCFYEFSLAQVCPETSCSNASISFHLISSATFQLHQVTCCFPWLLSSLVVHSKTCMYRNADNLAEWGSNVPILLRWHKLKWFTKVCMKECWESLWVPA